MNKLTSTWKQKRKSAVSNNKCIEGNANTPSNSKFNAATGVNVFPSLLKDGLLDENEKHVTVNSHKVVDEVCSIGQQSSSKAVLDDSYPLLSFEWDEGDLKALENIEAGQSITNTKQRTSRKSLLKQDETSNDTTHQSTPYTLRSTKLTNLLSPVLPFKLSTNHKSRSVNPTNVKQKNPLLIENWGLPNEVVKQYKQKGINEMFQWQVDCLMTGNVLNGGNLVYSAPTSAGKTLVAEILMLKRVLESNRKAIYILPFVSVTREKVHALKTVFQDINVTVEGFMGSQAPLKGFMGCDIAVCTIEKANSLVNRLIEDKTIFSVGCIILDELHMLGDSSRGYLLELMLTKLLYVSMSANIKSSYELMSQENSKIQIIGMSATLPNLALIASWLRSDLYITTFRPVELIEHVKVGQSVLDSNGKVISTMKSTSAKRDEEGLVGLCHETVHQGNSVLMFCPTKNWCEKLCEVIGMGLMLFKGDEKIELDKEAVNEILGQLQTSQVGLDPFLCACVKHGVAFHHAGLTYDERDIIEDGFRKGTIKVLIATLTLSSGVNLPARRVIIRTPMFHGKPLNPRVYKQMAGRAGRKGVDDKGESILICKANEKQNGLQLLSAELSPVLSCLLGTELQTTITDENFPELKRALLEIICSGAANSYRDVQTYSDCTFLKACLEDDCKGFKSALEMTFKYLIDKEFLRMAVVRNADKVEVKDGNIDNTAIVEPTQLGMATLASALAPKEALIVFAELRKARRCFVLENELHIIYQVTPINIQDQFANLDWYKFFSIWERLPSDHKTVGHLVGIEESYLTRALHGRVLTRTEENRTALGIHRRFFAALALQDLVNEVPLMKVCQKYGVNRGLLQSLQSSAATFAGMVTKFCQKLGWCNLELILAQFQSRLSLGINRQLCDLARVTSLNGNLARLFYNAGYHTVCLLAAADVNQIEKLLRESSPFESKKHPNYSNNKDRFLFISGRRGLTEKQASEIILKETKDIIDNEIAKLGGKPLALINPSNSKNNKSKYRKSKSMTTRRKRLAQKRCASDSSSGNAAKRPSVTSSSDSSTSLVTIETENTSAVLVNDNKSPLTSAEGDLMDSSKVVNSPIKDKLNEDVRNEEQDKIAAGEDSTSSDVTSNSSDLICASQVSAPSTSMLSKTAECDDECNVTDSTNASLQLSDVALFDDEQLSPSSNANIQRSPELCFDTEECNQLSDDNNYIQLSPENEPQPKLSFNDSEPSASLLMALDDFESKANPPVTKIFTKIIEVPSLSTKTLKDDRINRLDYISTGVVLHDHRKHLKVEIIDIDTDDKKFKLFLNNLKTKDRISISLGCELISNKSNIGQPQSHSTNVSSYLFQCGNEVISSLTLSWGDFIAYHFNLKHFVEKTTEYKVIKEQLQQVMNCISNKKTLILYDLIQQYKLFYNLLNVNLIGQFEDPKVADWLLDQDKDDCTFQQLCQQHLSQSQSNLLSRFGKCLDSNGLGRTTQLRGSGRSRSATEAILSYQLMDVIRIKLNAIGLTKSFKEVEMPTNAILSKMQCIGIGMSVEECSRIEKVLISRQHELESECYLKSGQKFSLASPEEVSRVLFIHLKLPNEAGTEANGRRSLRSGVRHLSTKKLVLEKLADVHILPRLIIEWRKIHNTLIKVIRPLLRICSQITNDERPTSYTRIFPQPHFRTATGRIAFSEPNLQSIPKDFDIELSSLPGNESRNSFISLRTSFIPREGYVFISADYCQMELRIIAHLANDKLLLRILSNRHGDVFKSIAAETNNVNVNDVTNELRQRAKQMCYGIIYGMGRKLLADQLNVDEKSADIFINAFKSRFIHVTKYVEETVKFAHNNGYVTTLSNRRRLLKSIHSRNVAERAQAERQAVNTTVQGSAADLTKCAMISIDKELQKSPFADKAYIVLQLHDELMYEVDVKYTDDVICIIRREMENAIHLKVITPVKVRVGKSWGELIEM